MKTTTSRKIFGHVDWTLEAKLLWEIDDRTLNGTIALYLINGKTAIIQEYEGNNGFEIYVQTPGNNLSEVHKALGITYDDKGDYNDE